MENPTNQTHDKQKKKHFFGEINDKKRVSENIILFIFSSQDFGKEQEEREDLLR